MTDQHDLYKYKALLLPWSVRGLDSFTLGNGESSWHDGDTFNALVSYGRTGYWITRVRCAGYNSPENRTGAQARAATDFVRKLVDTGEIVYLDSIEFIPGDENDSFGRMLARVTLVDGDDLSTVMIESGHGVPKER